MALVLFAPDVPVRRSPAARSWVLGMCYSLREAGHDVLLHPREENLGGLEREVVDLGVELLPHDPAEPDHVNENVHLPRFRARRVVAHARARRVDFAVVQGWELSLTVAGGRALRDRLISIPVDEPHLSGPLSPLVARRFESFVEGSRRILVVSDVQRADLESCFPASAARVGVLPTPAEPAAALSVWRDASTGPTDVEVCLDYFVAGGLPDLGPYVDATRSLRHVPRVRLTGASPLSDEDAVQWRDIPGLVLGVGAAPTAAPWGLVPEPRDRVAHSLAVAYHLARGARPVLVTRALPRGLDPRVTAVTSAADLLHQPSPLEPSEKTAPVRSGMPAAGPWTLPSPSVSLRTEDDVAPVRLLFIGQDLSSLASEARALAEHPDLEVRAVRAAEPAQDAPRTPLPAEVGDADLIVTASAGPLLQAVTRALRPDQRLIAHVPDGLFDENTSALAWERCDAVVVHSPISRQRLLEVEGTSADRVHVVPPVLGLEGMTRPKAHEARFHLGLETADLSPADVGAALRLLRRLRADDERHVLHLRGPFPWAAAETAGDAATADQWRHLFADIGLEEALYGGLVVEPAVGPYADWLRRVGWLLNPGLEHDPGFSFVPALAAGTAPVPLEDDDAAYDLIRAGASEADTFATRSAAARHARLAHNPDIVADAWLTVFADARQRPDGPAAAGVDAQVIPATEDEVLAVVEDALRQGSYERALELLDAAVTITSRTTGPVKDAELWVRGITALDTRRLTHYLPRTDAEFRVTRPPLLISCTDDHGTVNAPYTLELVPYPFRDPRDDGPAGISASPAGGASADGAASPGRRPVSALGRLVRADRWLEAHAGAIARHVQKLGFDHIVARGPWWVGFAAALAADRLRLPATWVVTQAEDVRRAERALATPYGADVLEHTVLRTFEGMSNVVDETGLVENSTLASRVPLVKGAFPTLPAVLGGERHAPMPDYGGVAEAVERNITDLTALVLGAEDFIASWVATGMQVIALDPTDLPSAIGFDVDLVVVDGALATDPSSAPLFTAPSARERSRLAVLFDTARSVGASSLVVGHRLHGWPNELIPTVRKADLLTVAGLDHAEPVLRLNPLAAVRVLPCVADRPWEDTPELFLRALGFAVRGAQSPEVTALQGGSDTVRPGVSLILATHRGAERIGGMLDSISAQTLPAHLIELVVVENGGEPESRAAVEEFEARTGFDVVYRFRDEPGVGGARNLGLDLATRSHVTFVDDDDLLGQNFLLAAWLASSTTRVVLSRLYDLTPAGEIVQETPQSKNVDSLHGASQPLELRPWALGQNACKLIPTDIARACRYPEDLHSGEDIVFMAQLMGHDLDFAPALELPDPAYLRIRRENSVSRRALTFDFAVTERLAVMAALRQVASGLSSQEERQAITALSGAQAGFVLRYRDSHPDQADEVDAAILMKGLRDGFDHLAPERSVS